MAFASKFCRLIFALCCVAATASLVWFGYSLNPWWPLLWWAPLPVLLLALRSSPWTAALAAGISWLLGSFTLWGYFRSLGTPFTGWLGIFSLAALLFAVAVLLFRRLVQKGAFWSALLAFPATWVSVEYIRNLTTPHGTAGSLAYSQLNFLPFLQLASITGPWGMSFLLLLFPAALAIGFHLRTTAPKTALRIVGTTLGIILFVLVFGVARLAMPEPRQDVRVGLIASDEPGNIYAAAAGADTERLFRSYAAEAKQLAERGAQFIVLPEKIGEIVDSNTKGTDSIFQRLADETNSTIIVGQVWITASGRYNEARAFAPRASILNYAKHHLLPPFESHLTPGRTLAIVVGPAQTWGVTICKDLDFTPLARKYGEAGVGLMLAPAWDFGVDRWWHGHIAVMRGVEDGFSIARAAKDGYLMVSDDRGRILAQTRSDCKPFATLLAEAPAAHQTTVYLLLGDWFAWLSCGIFVVTLFRALRLST